jgi:UDP-N-acetylglucosamine 2-epimerase (non-hydrolysing)
MIDSLEMLRDKILKQRVYEDLDLKPGHYGLVTLHRPSNVDDHKKLNELTQLLTHIADKTPLVFPIHPRTRKNLQNNGFMSILNDSEKLISLEPLSYLRFMNLLFHCRFAITDSGGIQEETTYLGIPCLTLRPNTERPITITQGTNQLCDLNEVESRLELALSKEISEGCNIELWDGKTAARVVQSIKDLLVTSSTRPVDELKSSCPRQTVSN